ncbi:CKLF-like MARVEL transmembrane domain-containing protein 4 [Cylas formicarius]|uniref:CKLF-like MARVEL transmembrane domain-containing protein 4 n=1 Tax=Cylas formicarius TaxID=197179 RepID=UPI002958B153|nr:CKLF-like MARVEL transmembrane domain-containing protein 4 [Cylas formicarius]XP_060517166.1 CKLF-like MARVEL transmembrane domain-containing protein 4 [Cylas formicarius]XP_060517167.1 CKLF-like MARVEL transmembrane domain-containing protein 4 [Cylas formicarius]XP_060517168.1 CKLF-like MARVEL transmembrane domain-containing protein 4 [Cylas formicarius]
MSDPGFPGQHSTTTTVKSSTTAVDTTIRFDGSYIRTLPGMLKISQVSLNLLGFICIEAGGPWAYHSRGVWFNFVAMTGFWLTLILLALYLFHIIERFYKIPWLKFELGYCGLWAGLYIIAASLALSFTHVEAFIAAGFFGFCAMIAYALDAFLKYKAVQSGQLAQGERMVSKQTTAVNSPTY